jgi:membrane fusion protein, copper/silver efflux system
MNSNEISNGQQFDTSPSRDEGGLHAPPELHGWRKAWWWFHLVILVNLARLRFVAALLVIGIVITKWDLLLAYYDRWTRPANTTAAAAAGEFEYFCPMHPTVIRDNPNEKCPICFMPLSKRKKGDKHEEVLPAGVVSRVQLSPYRVTLAGIQTWPVEYVPLAKEITAVGYIEFNERGERNVSARVAGRLDKLFVNETGQMVHEGDPLASLYSPDLIVSVQNLLDARKNKNQNLEESTRRRLELLGIGDEQITDIVKRRTAESHLLIRSPISGHVVNKYVREGEYVQEGTSLYDVVDLSTVWIEAQIYEDDLPFLPAEMANPEHRPSDDALDVMATTRSVPNEVFHGKLAFIYPHVDQQTRTVTVRFELDNPGHKLRPGSTATVTLRVPGSKISSLAKAQRGTPGDDKPADLDQLLAIPESSVIDTGKQMIVYRQRVPGVFEGVEVKLGPKMAGPEGMTLYPVVDGLKRGDQIVTSGSFLVDAETRLNPAAGSIYFGGSSGAPGSSNVTTVRPSTPEDEDAKVAASLATLSESDRKLAEEQQFCPILSENRLGAMGVPVKVMIKGQPVFLCCDGCKKQALNKPDSTLAKVTELKQAKGSDIAATKPASANDQPAPPSSNNAATGNSDTVARDPKTSPDQEREIQEGLAELPVADRQLAERQRFCAVLTKNRLGSMGPPVKVMIDDVPVFVCCEGCPDKALAEKAKTLSTARRLIRENAQDAGRTR